MLQFPALMRQWPSPPLIPASTLLPVPATTHEDELLLAVAESDHEDKVPSASPRAFFLASLSLAFLTPTQSQRVN
jgi:hypothetical protein